MRRARTTGRISATVSGEAPITENAIASSSNFPRAAKAVYRISGDSLLSASSKGTNEKLNLLWIACGKDDFLLEENKKLITSLKKSGIEHEWHLTESGHSWPVWRDYLAKLAPVLFR